MTNGTILAVDDDSLTLEMIKDALADRGFDVVTAGDGAAALAILLAEPEKFDAIVVDRVMPGMDGMKVLSSIRESEKTSAIPVILQTAAADPQAMTEGIEAGAFYYITKPYDENTLVAVVRSAVQSHNQHRFFASYAAIPLEAPETLEKARFRFSTFREAKSAIWMISQHALEPEWISAGLQELVTNAIEHGNLGIGGSEKEILVRENRWEQEIERRLSLSENADKKVTIDFDASTSDVVVRIEDQGTGFKWRRHLNNTAPNLQNAVQGRGILVAKSMPFHSFQYKKDGRCIEVRFARGYT